MVTKNKIVHHHLLFQAKVGVLIGENDGARLEKFLHEFLDVIDMKCLISPRLAFSHQAAWTGIMGIVTSHIAFHYWTKERYLQLDIYSCRTFDQEKAIRYIRAFWDTRDERYLLIDRETGKDFEIRRR